MKQDGIRERSRGSFPLSIWIREVTGDPGFPRTSDVINRAEEAEIYGDTEDR
jgi:hypothetical protein